MSRERLNAWGAVAGIVGVVLTIGFGLASCGGSDGGSITLAPSTAVEHSRTDSPGDDIEADGDVITGDCNGEEACQSIEVVPTTNPGPVSVPSSAWCPDPDPTTPARRSVLICVMYWCKGDVFAPDGTFQSDQYQIKMRPVISNVSSQPVDISVAPVSRIRLLVRGPQLDQRWSPGPGTKSKGDIPVLVNYYDEQYWAIAPNRPKTETATPTGMYTGFATKWPIDPILPAHESAGYAEREAMTGDLVFQVPLEPSAEEGPGADILGVALLDYSSGTPTVVTIDYTGDWPPPEVATSF